MRDWHDYSSTADFIKKSVNYGKDLDRKGPEVFLGDWGAHEEVKPWDEASKKLPPTPSMKAAIGDAVFPLIQATTLGGIGRPVSVAN